MLQDYDRRGFLGSSLAASILTVLGACETGEQRPLRIWALGSEAGALPQLLQFAGRGGSLPQVEVQALPWSAGHEKFLTGFAGSSLPELAQLGSSWVPEMNAIGALDPVPGDYLDLLDDQFDAARNTVEIDGRAVAVPWYVDTRLHFYRTDLFEAAGYDRPPMDWPSWKASLHRVKQVSGDGNYAILMPVNEFEHLTTFALSAKADFLRDNATRGYFDQPEFVEALSFYKSLFDEGLAPLASATQISSVWAEFARGFFAIYPSGPWTVGDMRSRLPVQMQDRWSTVPNPGPSGIGAASPGGASLVVFARATDDHGARDEAWSVIRALLAPPVQSELQRITGDLPARRSAWLKSEGAFDPFAAFAEQLDHARPVPKIAEWERIVTEMQAVAEAMLRGQFEIEDAVREMNARADRILAKRRWMIERGRS